MLSSRPGLGTCVELWLPVSAEDEERKVAHSLTEIAKGGEECVLLVDDEPLVRASTATMLSALGYGVIEAESGSEALRLMEERPVELIVSDQLMPGMTGTELAAEVGQRWPGIPVLIISGYADLESISPNLPRLNKPFRRRDLADAIEEAKRALAH
jgi:CheY-like chemotaxis protein